MQIRRQWIPCLLAGGAAGLTFFQLVFPFYSGRPPGLAENMQDTGAVLTMTRELLRGHALYAQIYTPYGPVPHALYEAMAWVFGNTPWTYAGFVAILTSLVMCTEFILVRRFLPVSLALLFYILVLTHFTNFTIIYASFEALGIFLLAIFWVPPPERTVRRCVLYGVILCLIHFSKFGSDVVAAASFVLLDLLYLLRSPEKARVLVAILRGGTTIAFAFAGLFVMGALPIVLRLPPELAKDTLWPLYMSGSYVRFAGAYRYPYYQGIYYFMNIYLPMLVGLFACLASVAALVLNRNFATTQPEVTAPRKDIFPYPLLLPPVFFVLACFVLLRHAWHYAQYGMYAALGASLLLQCWGKVAQRLTILVFVAYLFVAFWTWIEVPLGLRPAPVFATIVTPVGCALEGPPELVNFYQRLFSATEEEIAYSRTTTAIISLNDRPGIYYFSGREVSGRITWYLPTYLRPWEEEAEKDNFSRAGAIILGVPSTPAMNNQLQPQLVDQSLRLLFSPRLTEYLERRLAHPIFVGVDPSQKQVADWTFAISSGADDAASADARRQPPSP